VKVIKYHEKIFYIFPTVYTPSDDTFLLAEALLSKRGKSLCEVGCGCGLISILAVYESFNKALAIDLNPLAALNTALNAHIHGVDHKIDIVCCDLLSAIKSGVHFDLIAFNPPYLPVSNEDISYSGGSSGTLLLERFLTEVKNKKLSFNELLIVSSSAMNFNELAQIIEKLCVKFDIVAQRQLSFETLFVISLKPPT